MVETIRRSTLVVMRRRRGETAANAGAITRLAHISNGLYPRLEIKLVTFGHRFVAMPAWCSEVYT